MAEKKPYKVKVTETVERTVIVYAEDNYQAEEIAEELCNNGDIDLDFNDSFSRDISCTGPAQDIVMNLYEVYGKDSSNEYISWNDVRIFCENGEVMCQLPEEDFSRHLKSDIRDIKDGDAFLLDRNRVEVAGQDAHQNFDEPDEPWIVYDIDGLSYFENEIKDVKGLFPEVFSKENELKRPNITAFRQSEHDEFSKFMKFWSDSSGTPLSNNGLDISEKELPLQLQRAYADLYSTDLGSDCFLVETPMGYHIALANLYDTCFADDCGLDSKDLFYFLLSDAEKLSKLPEFLDTHIIAYENYNEEIDDVNHDLFVLFPPDMDKEDFITAAGILDNTAYSTAKELSKQKEAQNNRKPSLDDKIHSVESRQSENMIKKKLDDIQR